MSIISSKQQASRPLDPIFVLFLFTMVLLVFFAVFTGNIYHVANGLLGISDNTSTVLSLKSEPSFVADQQYWAANCTDGWSDGSMCETIVLRSQSCSISADSAYCSEYASYLQAYFDQQ
jgi:hypothetical protein